MPNSNQQHIAASSSSFSSSDQTAWQERSRQVISTVVESLKKNKSFFELLTYLGEERNRIARDLGHFHKEKGNDKPFGCFSSSRMQHGEGANSAPPVAQKMLLEYLNKGKLKKIKKSWRENRYLYAISEPYLIPFNIPATAGFVEKYHDETRRSMEESMLNEIKRAFDKTSELPPLSELSIKSTSPLEFNLDYPAFSSKDLVIHYIFAQKYYTNLLNWDEGKGLDDFLENAAKLSYLLAHRLPFQRGTSSIVEWMIKGIAEYKGLKNFPMKVYENIEGEELNWSWRALIEPDIKDYIQWYSLQAKQLGLTLADASAEQSQAASSSTRSSHSRFFKSSQGDSVTRMKELLLKGLVGDDNETIPTHLKEILEKSDLPSMFFMAKAILDSPQITEHDDFKSNADYKKVYKMLAKYYRDSKLSAREAVNELEAMQLNPGGKGCIIM